MKKRVLPIVVLTFLSSAVIFFRYLSIPQNITLDEIAFSQVALSLSESPYTVYSTLHTGHSTLYFYILLLSLKTFGVNIFAVRFPSALFSVASVLLFYLVMSKVFKNSFFAFFVSCIMLFLRWYINFSRFSYETTFLLFLELVSTLFLFKFLEDKQTKSVVFSGIFAGLAFHSYYPGRVFFLLPLFVLFLQKIKKYAVLFLLIFALIASPLISYLVQNPDIRVGEVSLLASQKLIFQEKLNHFGLNIKKTAFMFHVEGDSNGRHNFPGKPALNPILGILFLGGFVLALKNFSQVYNQYFLFYFLLSVSLPLIGITQDNPNMLRTFTTIPGIAYFIGKAYLWIWDRKLPKKFLIGCVAVLFILSTLYELRTYFLFQSRVFRNSFEIQCKLQDVVKYDVHQIPPRCRVSKNLF
ncbi:hypothetical protein A3G67_02195 [Candidatus Roizmanbacteria bacterium RIFCSPLOWO2_12_FULL_40_12]|uniref:Glycosyltransferase RgtA/B/C/D-like domain-containing protein n=1 Tax=Candidatus Roizmanbacteria bacterium RIFCSPLOWO2_01_FULL_40_42 TaxID=1802066 RepID=A0A1F7J3S4_9BACT|nr:MAG: hypothetical protein A2779_01400 [Candidatus Roizmanbacteria bacterium RIFCSPHIGHO2_01_FULL_40_98]OGK29015.1 MAG: hypothetical protein A3C31_02040 [Candidatus Roizmanbacteria bacterium RIFCSPHIGHO2_02_FULL_40_53]OGK29988.1 MAG: hypothetical protein A2W49_00170 [Candidatus Roizmanbacteria bacterium RIFCSPHIGHO2_12_41_18]OGK37303.1 MAG: hypothetical protein A3E69_04340 [Candidatus Roizmanbacteria bacterium RIFCSPHIGHO2_12_FULL_40_130]OGK50245.1 MAG: hypothetical protein A3B50_00495 [Candi